ncbi:hypothetical protein BST81_22900 [Leptolyngbya sp. 'hensonii']|uniref:helix-turn-helix domain-containing protein n=1 Tax=Leptolyngbya sp. 'hensonii' TaxID=1922337 RepID=UPI000950250F|nr:helix-turn-helix domain-containing protein [Leptolyngbya sp. 'hensonii']OLP16079.1 hypothetical protein BST81_22900 [Leptolyngbya sp. 'hensonii']
MTHHLSPTDRLSSLMHQAGIPSFAALARTAGVSEWQVTQLRQGRIQQMRVDRLTRLSQALQISLPELLDTFSSTEAHQPDPQPDPLEQSLAMLREEYQRLQKQLEAQQHTLLAEFQQASLQTLESWLMQWPTAAYAAQQNPQAPAIRLLPLVRPIEQLLQQWGVVAIGPVGSEVPYDPQYHQLMEGTVQPGARVRVRYTGYCQGKRLLFRAKVSPL